MRDVPKHVDDDFYAGVRTREIPFAINDSVVVVGGPNAGRRGAVISIESIRPEITVLIELGDYGKDVVVPITALRHLDATG